MKRILLVEDEVDAREMLDVLLRDEGFEVMTAADGRAALALLTETTPDLIVTDVMMPYMGGDELLAELRKSHVTRAIPVIVMSAGDGYEVARRYGAAFVRKPFDIDGFLRILRRAL